MGLLYCAIISHDNGFAIHFVAWQVHLVIALRATLTDQPN